MGPDPSRRSARASKTTFGTTLNPWENPSGLSKVNRIPVTSEGRSGGVSAAANSARLIWNVCAVSPVLTVASVAHDPSGRWYSTVAVVFGGTWVGAIATMSNAFQKSSAWSSRQESSTTIWVGSTCATPVSVVAVRLATTLLPGSTAPPGVICLSTATPICGK